MAVYVADTLNAEIISSLYLDITGCENIWLKMNCLNIVFGVIYRHPSNNTKLFLEQLNKNLELLNNAKLYLIGDLNINICSPNKNFSNDAIDFVNMLASYSFFPIISLPTRVTDTSATLIDHIITNDCKNSIFPGIIKTDLSDHYPIFCTIDAAARDRTSNNKSKKPIFQRDLIDFDSDTFCHHLHESLCEFFNNNCDVNPSNFNNLFSDCINIIKSIINFHAPLKKLSRKQLKLKLKPWITKGLLVSIKHKQQLYKTHFVKGNSEQKKFYKKYANKLNRIKFAAKQLYYQNKLENSKFNMFKTWKTVKSLLPSSNKKSSTPEKIKYNDELFSNPLDVANNFCDYFSKIGLKLASKISSHDDNAFKSYLGKSLSSSLFLCPTTYFEVLQEINSLKNKKSCGYDNIPVYFFKVAAKVLATPLSILFNYSLRYGIFPDCLKTAKVVPIFKKGDKNEINNYRPISLLSTFSKILEKLICKRMRRFLDKHSIISSNQYGFRSSLSTTHAMLDVLTSTYDNTTI